MVNERGRWARAAVVAVWAAVLIAALVYGPDPARVRAWIEAAGPAAPVAYLVLYVIAVFALVPRPALNLAAGLLFGLGAGMPLALTGGVGAALAQFAVARYAAGGTVARLLPEGVRSRLDAVAERHAFVAVLQLRLLPIVPYQAVNYGCGLTRMRVAPFALGTFAGGVPATGAMVLLGAGGTDLGLPVAVAGAVLAALPALLWWVRSRRRAGGRRAEGE
ncbi:VTT domain-containing protein [Nocardiopsis sp. N85]|uniref:TVP38/TMEM64 family protein n=1 Tax=Nocardiopsis sp. N85 TaxID=3029400 RepID=UPI00237F9AFF|nr:VTT domain-containing protein [Nocardiopsis sp. N85]MDE3723212.1 VTT domain-containing protein [Nocardiopsis sp. N85]